MAKKNKNIKPTNKKIVADKKSVKKQVNKSSKSNKSVQKKTPSKKINTKKPNKVTKKKTPSTKKKDERSKVKKGAGFSSNNFNYIRSLVWREYGLDYVSYFDPKFINIVKAVYNECKSAGQECTDKQILLFYDDILENPKRDFPYIDDDLYTNSIPYYQLLDVEFAQFPAYLWIFSPMIMPPPSEFIITSYVNNKDGSGDKGYRKYFKEFVDWANEAMRNQYGSEINSDDIDIFIKFTMPEYIESKQRWETEIFICNADGERESFGFTPKGRMEGHDVDAEFEIPIEKETPIETEKIPPHLEEKQKSVEELKVEKQKNENLFNALIKMKKKKEELERNLKTKSKRKIKVQRSKVDIQKQKQGELKRLIEIKKEIEKNIRLYMKLKDKKRLNKTLIELDKLMLKIKKLS